MKLQMKDLSCGYGGRVVVEAITFDIDAGETVCLLGPNGVGKTTFYKTVLGFIKPLGGRLFLDGKDTRKWSRKNFAQSIAYVPQAHMLPFPFPVIDVVVAGRNAHLGITSKPNKMDYEIALQNLEELGIGYLEGKLYTELSGGEQQMVLIARALTQTPGILIMDEPTSNLDLGNQVKVINLINMLKKKEIAVMLTTHSPDHAFFCGTKVVIFQSGKQVKIGDPQTVMTEEVLSGVYGTGVNVCQVGSGKKEPLKICVPNISM